MRLELTQKYWFSGSRVRKKLSTNEYDPDILLAGVNKLRREGKIYSADVSEISDSGLRTPEDAESVSSDIFGVPEFAREGEELFGARVTSGRASAGLPRYTAARPVARRSLSRELPEPDPLLSPTYSRRTAAQPRLSREGSAERGLTARTSPLTLQSGSIRDRRRDDWRRISVPERGKDFNSLPRKYNR